MIPLLLMKKIIVVDENFSNQPTRKIIPPQKHYENQLQICIRFALDTPLLSIPQSEQRRREREGWGGVGSGMGGGGG